MQLLADQNVHRRLVLRLRQAGYAVEFILETMPGALDETILARPDIAEWIFITGDKGFGDWIFNHDLPRPRSIVLNRLPHPEWDTTAKRLIALLEDGIAPGQMITIKREGVRTRPFPTGADHG